MKRMVIAGVTLLGITLVNFWFYITFKPEAVIINRIFARFLGRAGSDYEPTNWATYAFYHAFGDGLAVLMVMLAVSIILRLIRMPPSIWYFRLILVMFLVLESAQVFLPGNFKWVDMGAYVIFYHLGLFMVEAVLEQKIRVRFKGPLSQNTNRE